MKFFTLSSIYYKLIIFALFVLRLQVVVGQVGWARQAGGSGILAVRDMAVDGQENAYVVGEIDQDARFGTSSLNPTAKGVSTAYLASYDKQGAMRWAQTAPAISYYDVATDATGNVYVLGSFTAGGTLSGTAISTQGTADILLVKYSPDGKVLWARTGGATAGSSLGGSRLALDAAANVYVAGSLQGSASPGGSLGTITSESAAAIYLAKYNTQGEPQWARQCGGKAATAGINGLGIDAAGDLYLMGIWDGTLTLGPFSLSAQANDRRFFLAKCTESGQFNWLNATGGPGYTAAYDMAVDAQGNSLITGMLGGTPNTVVNFGSTTFSVKAFDGFVVKHDAAGNLLWARQLGGDNTNYGTHVAFDPAGNAYVTGVFSASPATWDATGKLAITTVGGKAKNVFAVKYDALGNVLAVQREGLCGSAYYPAIAVTASQHIYLAGTFADVASFVSTLFSSANGQIFVARLGDLRVPSTPATFSCAGPVTPPNSVPPPPPAPAPDPSSAALTIPNVITPNGDGLNDYWKINGLAATDWAVRIYSRWGQQVYQSGAYPQDWNAEGLPAGVYYYRLWQPGTSYEYRGWLEVLR